MSTLSVTTIKTENSTTALTLATGNSSGSFVKVEANNTVWASGNVGIGTANPTQALDVTGSINASGTVAMGSSFMRNKVINGDMRIDQRNNGNAISVELASSVFCVDRFSGYGHPADGVFTLQRVVDAPTGSGFNYSLKASVLGADASIGATQTYFVQTRIEGYNVADLMLGVSSTQKFTLSFWVKSSVTGSFGGSVGNNVDLSCPFTYTINQANTWEYKTVTFTSPASGTWNTTTGVGLILLWSMGMGSSNKGTAGTWANYPFAPTGSVDLISTLGATWNITGVQLEAGSVATPFERRHFGQELLLCQRYYCKSYPLSMVPGTNTGLNNGIEDFYSMAKVRFYVLMRSESPVVTVWDSIGNINKITVNSVNNQALFAAIDNTSDSGFKIWNNATSTNRISFHWTASAEL